MKYENNFLELFFWLQYSLQILDGVCILSYFIIVSFRAV